MIYVHCTERIEFQLLGPLGLRTSDHPNLADELTAPKPRKIIALLVIQANHIVPTTAMARELWGDNPPTSVQTTLQTYVLQARRLLSRALHLSPVEVARRVLVTKFGGYQLNLHQGGVDIHEFARLAAEGQQALTRGEYEKAVQLLTDALDLWSGPPLVDIQAGPLLTAEIRQLEENRLTVLMQRVDAKLRLNLHDELPAELAGLAAQYPTNESLHAQYMLALYRCGRCPDALDVFRQLREHLVGELGLEPSLRIRGLHHAMLSADPALDRGAAPTDGTLLLDRFGGTAPARDPWLSPRVG